MSSLALSANCVNYAWQHMIITAQDYANLEKLTKVQLATSLPGAKPICLVGTQGKDGCANLAPFSSVGNHLIWRTGAEHSFRDLGGKG